jgi:two-component system response regulator RegA
MNSPYATGLQAIPRLLLVDDDQVLCAVLARALERRGFAVSVAGDFAGALAAADVHGPQFAVVDLKFPGGTGLALVERLVEAAPGIRIVMLTGYASIATAIEAVKRGAHYYLAKPANADDVVKALGHNTEGKSLALANPPIAERPLSVNRLQWEHIHRVLTGNNGNISATARELGMHRRTLQRKLNKHPVRA